MLPTQKAVPM